MTSSVSPILLGKGPADVFLLPRLANRHGLIAGATGTGKTVSLQVLAESFSEIGVPVFMADVKGDLSGISQPGGQNPKVLQRAQELGLQAHMLRGYPVTFWDILGESGHPVRTTISEMGPILLARLLDLNETQTGLLNLVFRVADDRGLLLLDLKDLRAMLQYVGDNAKDFTTDYGTVAKTSIGAIQRGLLTLEEQGGERFFGEPALAITDLLRTDASGAGIINILAADKLIHTPKLYSTFLLWLLSELFEQLPEVGDLEKPRLVFFFDEAHLLFDETPKALQDKIEQVVRLIRSKGVGVYFVTQSPLDVPEEVLGQLGNRVQHALRAFTPRDQKAVRSAAETFRSNPAINVETAITELGVGEALVSCLDEKGSPGIVQRVRMCPPHSLIGPINAPQREQILGASPLHGKYEQAIDRESAYEKLRKNAEARQPAAEVPEEQEAAQPARRGREPESIVTAMAKSTARAIGSQLGRQIVRGVLGALLGGGRRR